MPSRLFSPAIPLAMCFFFATQGLSKEVKHLVSTSLASDEILLEFQQKGCKSMELIAISSLSDDEKYSNISKQNKSVKGRVAANLEAVLSFKPDLVINASYNNPIFMESLKNMKIPSLTLTSFNSYENIKDNISLLGKNSGCTKEAQSMLTEMSKALAQIKTPNRKIQVLGLSGGRMVIGNHTIFDSILKIAGGKNALSPLKLKGWSNLSLEAIPSLTPDLILVTSGENVSSVAESLRKTEGWKELLAVKKGKVHGIAAREISATSHHIVKAIIKLNRILLESQ